MLKNEKGMAMVLTLLVGAVVTLLGTTMWYVSNKDIIQVQRDEDSAQAYYYAKSGVELAIGKIMENGPDYLNGDNKAAEFYGSLGNSPFSSEKSANYNIAFTINRENDDFVIKSTGIVRKGDADGTQVSSNAVGFTISLANVFHEGYDNGEGSGKRPDLDMIFGLDGIDLSNGDKPNGGNSDIIGNVGTNSTKPNSVVFAKQSCIYDGDLSIGPGVNWEVNNVVTVSNCKGQNPDDINIPDGTIKNLDFKRNYLLPIFPDIEELAKGKNVLHYTDLNADQINNISIGSQDVIVETENLLLCNKEIILNKKVSDPGRLILYVTNNLDLDINGDCAINQSGSYDDLYIFYKGNNDIELSGNAVFVGSIFALNSSLLINGSSDLKGHIITGGAVVDIKGGSGNGNGNGGHTLNAIIYAPNAIFEIQGSSYLKGNVVAKKINMIGNATIDYDVESMDMDFYDQLKWQKIIQIPNKNWWVGGQWTHV